MSYGENAPTVVVGGGIMGAAILYELACREEPAILFEARAFGHESTGKSAAIVRMHYSNAPVVRMALRSREIFASMPDLLGCEPVYHATGWLFLVDEDDAEFARANRAMQLAEGSESEEVDPASLAEYVPGIVTDGIAYAIFELRSGFADPVAATTAYLEAARQCGARAYADAPVDHIETRNGRVTGVRVKGQRIKCERVVLAAGAWSGKLAAAVGVDLPLEFTREQDVVYDTSGEPPMPVAISDQADRIYLRPLRELGERLIVVGRGFPKDYEHVDPDAYNPAVDEPFECDVRKRLVGRIPAYESARVIDGRVGLYAVTPDWHPLLGPATGVEGLWIATGGSGHCFKLAPAIGEMLVGAMVSDPVTYADIDLFALDRFEHGRKFRSTYGGNRA